MNGWQAVCQQLELFGVERIFGLPGTQNAEMFSELARGPIKAVTTAHEMSAAFAAIGSALSSGRPGVLLTISGPGFCYTVPALAEATHDSVPLLHLVIRKKPDKDRRFQLQDLDHEGLAARVAKSVRVVSSSAALLDDLCWAWSETRESEPGPVVLIIDSETLNVDLGRQPVEYLVQKPVQPGDDAIAAVAAQLLGKRVLLIAGRGAHAGKEGLRRLVERCGWTAMMTTSGRGILDENHDSVLRTDQTSVRVLNHIVEQHDLVLAIGVKFSHNASFGFGLRIAPEKLVHVDASRAVLDANYPAQFSICADAGEFCSRLEQKLDFATTSSLSDVEAWQEQLDESRDDSALEPNFSGCPGGSAAAFFGALQSHFPPDAMYVSDSGYHQMLLRRYMIASDSPQLLVPSNFQSMGFGLPAAIGAALEYPNRIVVCIHGDGGFQMCATDLATAVQLRLNMRVFVFDDGYYGLIRKQQLGSGDIANGIKVPAMDLLAVARATGADFVDTSDTGIEDTLKSLDNVDGPVLVRQVLSESSAQAKFYARKQMKGRIRRFIGSDAMDFLRRYRK